MKELTIINQDGILLVDSREVAEMIGKEHKNLLRDIKGYIEVLEGSKLSSQKFFIYSTYKNSQNKEQPCYLLTRKGCDLVANKMTGEKGILFTAEYVTKFEEMEFSLTNPMSKLSKELKAIFVLDEKQQQLETKVNNLENNMTIDHGQAVNIKHAVDIAVKRLCYGSETPAYSNKELKRRIYSYVWRSIKDYFNVTAYHNLLRKDIETALNYVQNIFLQGSLLREVQTTNNQMSF
jgi:Rha family phage regulatory protein